MGKSLPHSKNQNLTSETGLKGVLESTSLLTVGEQKTMWRFHYQPISKGEIYCCFVFYINLQLKYRFLLECVLVPLVVSAALKRHTGPEAVAFSAHRKSQEATGSTSNIRRFRAISGEA